MLWLLIAVEYHFRHKRRSMESATTLASMLNRKALYRAGYLNVEVTIIDVRERWGNAGCADQSGSRQRRTVGAD
jgi:hypothetical protein